MEKKVPGKKALIETGKRISGFELETFRDRNNDYYGTKSCWLGCGSGHCNKTYTEA